tara:strand:- start:74 stop:352 length:279 start_codon:yes stop_codon:yes gene_type:complete
MLMMKVKTFLSPSYQLREYIGQIEISQNIRKLLEFYFFEEILFVFCIFLVRGIVDKTKDITNNKVIPIRVQKVRFDNSNSPNEIVWYKFNFL